MIGSGAARDLHGSGPQWRGALYGSALWRLWLRRGGTETIVRHVADAVPGDAKLGDALFTGSYSFQGETLISRSQPVWEPEGHSAAWLEDLHGFLWIRELRAAGDELAALHARKLIESWLEAYAEWHPSFWRLDILSNRVSAWMLHADFLLRRADDDFRRRFETALTAQVRHLAHGARPSRLPSRPMAAARGLLLSSLLLSGGAKRLRQAQSLLPQALKTAPGYDPAVSPVPSECVGLLEQLITLRGVLIECGDEPTAATLAPALRETTSCLSTCLLGDHQLGRFHGGVAGEASQIRRLVNVGRDAGPGSVDATGYRRMSVGGTTVLADFGLPPTDGSSAPLSFEMSDADLRMIVNCGPVRTLASVTGTTLADNAAHSTLSVDGSDARLRSDRRNPMVTAERRPRDDGEEVTGMHRGYEARYGIVHVRRLVLTRDGRTLTGTDTLTGRREHPFAIRFHLHPKVHPIGGEDSHSILLSRSGREWEFRFEGEAALSIEPSVYVDNGGDVADTWQVVLSGRYRSPASAVTWQLLRSDSK